MTKDTPWSRDPALDWPSRFGPGDVVQLRTGGLGVVHEVRDCSADGDPPRYEVYVVHLDRTGTPDVDIFEPWDLTPAPDPKFSVEARRLGLI